MAPCKTEQPLEPSSVAAPVAVGRANAKDASRCSSACPVGSSLTQPKATTTQLDAVANAKEFDLQGKDGDDEISDTSGPPNPLSELEPQNTGSQQADPLNGPVDVIATLDLLYFFTGIEQPTQGGPIILKQGISTKHTLRSTTKRSWSINGHISYRAKLAMHPPTLLEHLVVADDQTVLDNEWPSSDKASSQHILPCKYGLHHPFRFQAVEVCGRREGFLYGVGEQAAGLAVVQWYSSGTVASLTFVLDRQNAIKCPWVAQVSAHKQCTGVTNPLFSRFPISLESPVLTDPLVSLRAMAPCKTKQPLEPSSVAAPVAVGRVNAKGGSRRPSARPVGSSQTRSKATTTQLDAVVSAEEFDLQGIDDDDEISDISGPPNPSPKLEPQRTSPQQADALNRPVKSNVALDLVHFFTGMGRTRGKRSSNGETPPPKICKLCSTSGHISYRANWAIHLPTDARNKRDPELPSFSPEAFLEHLVRFVVQMIRCVWFFARLSLTPTSLACDKMREAVISEWRNSFERLKSDLSVEILRADQFHFRRLVKREPRGLLSVDRHTGSQVTSQVDASHLMLHLSAFIASRRKHTGVNIAKNILHLLDRANVTLKIGHFTLDNAENNAVAMEELESLLARTNGLRVSSAIPQRARRIIRLLRSSDQRREGFLPELNSGDVKTRWDSVFMMLRRLRVLRP
ncbi:hypothetical protein F5888DRAFT_1633754, partial [Russula emetica]